MVGYSCYGCQRRQPACHSKCPEYLDAKAKYDALKAEHNKKEAVYSAIYGNRCKKVNKALKKRRK